MMNLRILTLGLFVVALVGCGPLGPLPGGRLVGHVESPPVSWSSIAETETFQLETRPSDPHSVNIWAVPVDGGLYVATSLILGTDVPADRAWVKHVDVDPRVRLRAGRRIFELRAVRVENTDEATRARQALVEKYSVEEDAHSSGAWIYRLENR